MTILTRETAGSLTFLEGTPGLPLLRGADDVTTLLEECELAAAEECDGAFGVFDSRTAALAWLTA
jgi:hypothetical protein